MDLRRFWHPRILLALGALATAAAIVACGGTTTTQDTTGDSGSGAATGGGSAAPSTGASCHSDPRPLRRRRGADANRAVGRYRHTGAGAYGRGR